MKAFKDKEVNGKKVKILEATKPPFATMFSPLQIQARDLAISHCNKLIAMQTKSGSFSFKKEKANYYQEIVACSCLLDFINRKGYINYPFSSLDTKPMVNAAVKGANNLLKYTKSNKKFVWVKIKNKYEDSAELLNLLAYLVKFQSQQKWTPDSKFKLTDDSKFLNVGQKLANFIYRKRKFWPDDKGVIYNALFNWIRTCSTIWAYNPEFETNKSYIYSSKDKIIDEFVKNNINYLLPTTNLLYMSYSLSPNQSEQLHKVIKINYRKKLTLQQRLTLLSFVSFSFNKLSFKKKAIKFLDNKVELKIKAISAKSKTLKAILTELPVLLTYAQFPGRFL